MTFTYNDIQIRTELKPGDLGYLIYLHAVLYNREYQFGIQFESYVARGVQEFYSNYDPVLDRIWICEHATDIVGFLILMHRENNTAQLRYFLIHPGYRGIGLGTYLMGLFMDFLRERDYKSAYLWTTQELKAAISLYEKNGFLCTEETETTTFGKLSHELRFDLQLQA